MNNIFESLYDLDISEECFSSIINLVEEYINEVSVGRWRQAAINSLPGRIEKIENKEKELDKLQRAATALRNKKENYRNRIKDESKLPTEEEVNQAQSKADKASNEYYKGEGAKDYARVNHATRVYDLDNKLDDKVGANAALNNAHKKFNSKDGYKDEEVKKIIDTDPVRSRKPENRDERDIRMDFKRNDWDIAISKRRPSYANSRYSRSIAKHGGRGERVGSTPKGGAFTKPHFESYLDTNILDRALEIIESFISEKERSAADLVRAARNNYLDRKQDYNKSKRWYEHSFFGMENNDRINHAGALASLPNPKKSGVSARKLFKAASNSYRTRDKELDKKYPTEPDKKKEPQKYAQFQKDMARRDRALNIVPERGQFNVLFGEEN